MSDRPDWAALLPPLEYAREEATDVWAVLDSLLERAEVGSQAVLLPLLEAETAMVRLQRAASTWERRKRRRKPVTHGEVVAFLRRFDELAALPGWAKSAGAEALLATVRERVEHVAELLADSDTATTTPAA